MRGFGPTEGQRPLRGFGNRASEEPPARQVAAAVTAEDRAQAAVQIQKTDGNGDGIVTEAEWVASGFQPVERFRQNDLNGDGKLTLWEHSQRWAQYRAARQRPTPPAGPVASAAATAARDPRSESRLRQAQELAGYLLPLYDRNRNGAVERGEFRSATAASSIGAADGDRNGTITQVELADWLRERLAAQRGSQLPDNAPTWFLASDENLDEQVQLAEFLRLSPRGSTAPFERYDGNGDGFVTAKELASEAGSTPGRHDCRRPQVVEADRKTYAELHIRDEVLIQDIDVQLAIAKNSDDDVELALIGPDGARADLYFDNRTKPWGGGRLFENTTLDDEAPDIPQRLLRPPVPRSFRPQGMKTPGMQGLKTFYGKPARGTWRLVINNKSQSAGLLESWGLVIKPAAPKPPRAKS